MEPQIITKRTTKRFTDVNILFIVDDSRTPTIRIAFIDKNVTNDVF